MIRSPVPVSPYQVAGKTYVESVSLNLMYSEVVYSEEGIN